MKLFVIVTMFVVLSGLVSGECKPQQNEKYRTTVEYNGTLTCQLTNTFCALIYYVEWDRIARNEDLHFIRLHCTKTGSLDHHAYVYFTGGDGWNDDYYEPRIEVFHDCTDVLIRQTSIDLEPVNVYQSSAKRSYSFDITKRGKYDLFDRTHRDRYKDIPGENNQYIADWFAFEQEKTLKHEGIFEKFDEPEEGCLKA